MSKYLEGEAIHRISPMATVPQRIESREVLHPVGPHLEAAGRSSIHRTHESGWWRGRGIPLHKPLPGLFEAMDAELIKSLALMAVTPIITMAFSIQAGFHVASQHLL